MSSYTVKLCDIIEKESGVSIKEHMNKIRDEIFDFEYPFFNELGRKEFELDFIRNYYMREIGFETPHHFIMRLENWLVINMPYWNEMLKSEGLIKNPLINVDWTETRETERDITSSAKGQSITDGSDFATSRENSSGTTDTFNRNIETDTPDSRLQITTGADGTGVIEYASRITENKDKASSAGTTTNEGSTATKADTRTSQAGDSKDSYKDVFHVKGTQGMKTESEMLTLYRETLLRIKSDIYKEMNVLFMLVY